MAGIKWRPLLKKAACLTGAVLTVPLVYLAAAWLLGNWTVNAQNNGSDVELYLVSNGVHVDLVVPLVYRDIDWRETFSPADTRSGAAAARFAAIGWGERNFYLHTPSWSDLRATTALRALSGANRTLMHVSFYREVPEQGRTVRLRAGTEQYRRLAEAVRRDFAGSGRAKPLQGIHYHDNDAFYEANGRYHAFFTCNSWVNRRLKEAGLRAAVWTPFADPLLALYR